MYRILMSRSWRWAQAVVMVLAAGFFAGCATTLTVSAWVASFQEWPAGATGQRYRFVPADPGQNNNLEYQSFQDMVRSGISPTGLVEAQPGQSARLDVASRYGVTRTQVNVRRPYDPYFMAVMARASTAAGIGAARGGPDSGARLGRCAAGGLLSQCIDRENT